MRARPLVATLLVLVASSIAVASEPGQPLDCSDMVILQPGLSCTTVIQPGSELCAPIEGVVNNWCQDGNAKETDNRGGMLLGRGRWLAEVNCGTELFTLYRYEFLRLANGSQELIAYIDDRCGVSNTKDGIDAGPLHNITFAPTTGRLTFSANSVCGDKGQELCGYPSFGLWLGAIDGFETLFDVLHTFSPQAASLGFRVPYMPEGMAAADHFDTYWGNLSTVGDWSQAQGLQCGYPAAPPSVGDYLTVTDTLPQPAPDTGYYYVTAATYQGQTRYGRKTSGGRLTGRDPAVLPNCAR